MKRTHFKGIMVSLLAAAILLTSCGDVFLDGHYANADITAVRDPNRDINPRIQRVPQPEISDKVSKPPTDFNIESMLSVLNGINSPLADQEFAYTTVDLKNTGPFKNYIWKDGDNIIVSNINSKVENDSFILNYEYSGIQYTFIQDPYGRLTLSRRTDPDNSEFTETWITGSDGSRWHSESQWNGRYYHESTDNEDCPIREYRLDDQDPLRSECNTYRNGMKTELDIERMDGKETGRKFTSIIKGTENNIKYTRTAKTNEQTGKLIGYDVELSGSGASTYTENNISEILGFDISVKDESMVMLRTDTFIWKFNTGKTTEEMKQLLESNDFAVIAETDRKLTLEKGETVVEILKNPGAYDIHFTFPIEDLPKDFRK